MTPNAPDVAEMVEALADELRQEELRAREDLAFAQQENAPAKVGYFTGQLFALESARKRVAAIAERLCARGTNGPSTRG